MKNTTQELLANAGCGYTPMNLPTDFAPERADLTPQTAQLEEIEQRIELEDALQHTIVVSDAVREACERELFEAERRGWRL